ncbi:MAG TPA: bifunctional DNA-binding transcriptional regulator/O6-methylguanine-DNA methyltransferase Ada [Asticcacaulis sp.]|nr:bifunctional DNA-binding transcriptional regulator/O6-methylguanine-DNA methyltransferase Ada [Asticcacaulis sp.]
MTSSVTHLIETDPRWDAVLRRAPDADFVYGVLTTGIYCRASCPSRRPRPENVAFFDNCDAAEAAGLRACLRCRPRGEDPAVRTVAIIAQACRRIEASDALLRLDDLAREAGLSPYHFHRLFRAQTGVTPQAYARAQRDKRMRAALDGDVSVTGAIYDAGYGSASRFYEGAAARLGMTASRYRDGGAGEAIRFAIAQSSLGAVLVAESDKGVCAISLGDDPEGLTQALQDRFPAARLTGDDPAFDARVAQVVALVEAPRLGLDLPLDIRGTAFQQRVWQALRALRPGETLSYAELAQRLKAPRAVRAVAGACAANVLAVAIPCHRIVRSDGGLSGYRWGVARKAALLEKERDAG